MGITSNQKPLSDLETSAFCSQMAMILKSGISAQEGLQLMLDDAQSEEEKTLLTGIYDELMQSGMLGTALRKAGVFPDYMLQMTDIAEETGTLDEVMASLSNHFERENTIAQNIKNALTYPFIMISMMLLIIVILLAKVMPVFNQVFLQLGQEMTGISRGILAVGNALSRYSFLFIAIAAAIILLFIYLTKTEGGRKHLGQIGSHFKFAKTLQEKRAACRLAGSLSLTLKSGFTPERALELSEKLINDNDYRNKIISCKEKLLEGGDLSNALSETGLFTGLYARMISIAGKTGSMDEVMNDIADRYEEEIDSRIANMISILEPTLVIILSIIVGMILLSVMLPLLGIMAGL